MAATDDAIRRSEAMLDMIPRHDHKQLFEVLKVINKTADERGDRMREHLEFAKQWVRDLKEITGS